MSFLPIVERELRVVARKASVYRRRMWVALLGTGAALVFLAVGQFTGATRLGGEIFSTLVGLAFLYCLFEGLRAADALSEEKREGTLGLLFLTDLRGYDVVLGKLVAIAVRSGHGLLAFLPVLATAMILGGVTAGEFWRSALVLLNTLFFSLAIALCVSALSRQAHRAIGGTVLVLGLMTAGPLLVRHGPILARLKPVWEFVAMASPATTIRGAQDAFFRVTPAEFWISLGVIHGLSWVALGAAASIARTSWREREPRRAYRLVESLWQRWQTAGGEVPVNRAALLDVNPFLWLSARRRDEPVVIGVIFGGLCLIGLVGGIAIGPSVAAGLSKIVTSILLAGIGWSAVRTFAEARQSGALELFLATPLRVEEMIEGQWLALRKLFAWPAAFVLLLRVFARFGPQLPGLSTSQWHVLLLQWVAAGLDALSFVVSLLAIPWLGMWMGIKQKKLLRAFLLTVLLGLILPAVLLCLPNLVIHLALLFWARARLLRDFRGVASGDSGGPRRYVIRHPATVVSAAPPVILPGR